MTQACPLFPDLSLGADRSGLPLTARVVRLARRLWPVKAARQLSARAGVSERAVEQWAAEATQISGAALAELLRSDIGLAVLEEVMGDARPQWWPRFRRAVVLGELERRAEDNRRAIARLREELA